MDYVPMNGAIGVIMDERQILIDRFLELARKTSLGWEAVDVSELSNDELTALIEILITNAIRRGYDVP